MKQSKARRSIGRFATVASCAAWTIGFAFLGSRVPVAHGEDVTVEFEGTIIGVCPGPAPFFSCFDYTLPTAITVGQAISGSYTLSTTATGFFPPTDSVNLYPVSPAAGSIQIGPVTLLGSEDFYLGTQFVQILNDVDASPPPQWERVDSWTLLPLQAESDAITGGDHFCQILFATSGTATEPPEKLTDTEYFVNENLD